MAVCSRCGEHVADNASFCGTCGQPIAATAPAVTPTAVPSGDSGMAQNVAGLFAYSLGWVTGIIFLLIDKRPFVRFHAAQSIVVFGGLSVIYIILERIFISSLFYGGYGFFSFGGLLLEAFQLVFVVLWVFLMIKAYQGELFKLPIAADIAENLAKK
jgi:uncharacterized membrane protein